MVIDLFVKTFNTYFEWKDDEPGDPIGYKGFTLPDLRVFLDMGAEVLERSKTETAPPMFVVSTEADRAVSNPDHETLFENLFSASAEQLVLQLRSSTQRAAHNDDQSRRQPVGRSAQRHRKSFCAKRYFLGEH